MVTNSDRLKNRGMIDAIVSWKNSDEHFSHKVWKVKKMVE